MRYGITPSNCPGANCLVVASDTDVWVYGLGLWEAGWLRNKLVIVQRGTTGEYVNINLGARLIKDFPSLKNVPYPISTMVALYVLTGCDYVSAFFKHTKQEFISCFFSNVHYILNNNSLLTFVQDGNGHQVFEGIVMETWLNLVTSVYLSKHSTICSGQTLERFRDSFKTPPLSDECQRLLGWVGLGDRDCLTTDADWCDFVRAISFHKETAKKDFEAHIMPSLPALDKHRRRAEYVLHMVYSSPFSVCTQLPCFQSYGWTVDSEDRVLVDWDDEQTVSYLTGTDKGCSCKKSKCTSTCKCKNSKKPCTIRCACKDSCINPYNGRTTSNIHPTPSQNQPERNSDEQSESACSDLEELLVEGEVEYNSDEYDMEL